MRYVYARFMNYIGFYNGLGLNKVEIDFSKSMHHIVLISGMNGCGKSTLMNSLNPFPDSSTSYIPNQDGEKQLVLVNGPDTYHIQILSPSDNKGGRKPTKAFIMKNNLELNPTGNVTTYKDIIFNEFDLDSNYASLTSLSSNDRGLGDKKPAERKKFVSSIIENLEVYNNMYKTLNKKSLVLKSQISTIHTKIQNIGTENDLKNRLIQLQNRNTDIQNQISDLRKKIVEITTRVSINQEEAQKIQSLEEELSRLKAQIDEIETKERLLQKELKLSLENIKQKYDSDCSLLEQYREAYNKNHTLWVGNSERLSEITKSIHELEINLESFQSGIDDMIEKNYLNQKKLVEDLEKKIPEEYIDKKDELKSVLSIVPAIQEKIYRFYDSVDDSDLLLIVTYDSGYRAQLSKALSEADEQSKVLNDMRVKIENRIYLLEDLKKRPTQCKIDSCPFIEKAASLGKETTQDIELKELEDTIKKIDNLSKTITEIQEQIDRSWYYDKKSIELQTIRSEIEQNKELLAFFGFESLVNASEFVKQISNNSKFDFSEKMRALQDLYNDLIILDCRMNSLFMMEVNYNAYQDKKNMILKTEQSLLENKKTQEELQKLVASEKIESDRYYDLCSRLEINLVKEKQLVDLENSKLLILNQKQSIDNQIEEFRKKSEEALTSVSGINYLNNQIEMLSADARPIISEIQKLSGQLTLLESYYQDLTNYQTQYDLLEVLKKYCSPTGGGIQTVFMQMYMEKTLILANQVLHMLFGGEYQLCRFVINQNEFRIPFIGSGLEVDDISSGSTSQISIMGMAINLVLFQQASSKFNIARLDEIDGGLDHRNRFQFVDALYKIIGILNIDQLFIISHSMEADTSSVDIIKLKGYPDYEDTSQMGNIIYDYSKEIQQNN